MSRPEHKRILYMIGALSRPQVISLINNHCTDEEKAREQEILQKWETSANHLRHIEQTEPLTQNITLGDIEDSSKLDEISNNANFQNTFSNTTTEFKTI